MPVTPDDIFGDGTTASSKALEGRLDMLLADALRMASRKEGSEKGPLAFVVPPNWHRASLERVLADYRTCGWQVEWSGNDVLVFTAEKSDGG
jgi:hypothetical protein